MKKWWVYGILIAVCLISLFSLIFFTKNESDILSPQTSLGILKKENYQNLFSVPDTKWTLLVSGDVIPARSVNFQSTQKNDFMWPFRGIADTLKNADLTLINLESPLIPNCPLTNEGMVFCGDQRFGQSLKDVGVDIANLANNHSLNYGWEGIRQTETLLNSLGIETVGYTRRQNTEDRNLENNNTDSRNQTDKIPGILVCQNNIYCSKMAIKEVGDIKVGFLGYNTVGQKLDRDLVKEQINQIKQQADLLVISIHWGVEYTKEPQPESEDPKELGKWLIDQGADIIIGNHPHQIQAQEYYNGKLILYALGNTVFDQEWSPDTKKGILVKLYFSGTNLLKDKTEIIPIGIKNYGESYLR